MHAVVIRDDQLHWEERDDPVPGDTELLVAVRAAGINWQTSRSGPACTLRRPAGRRTSRAWNWRARWSASAGR